MDNMLPYNTFPAVYFNSLSNCRHQYKKYKLNSNQRADFQMISAGQIIIKINLIFGYQSCDVLFENDVLSHFPSLDLGLWHTILNFP